ncbi:SDR family oxidoreductase [Streptomyces violaceusniger]|uniref:SDR family oxidoreductase n=1 Tax=Streptomyces violaceusniger TaxID=68280 RepID=UPI00369444C5
MVAFRQRIPMQRAAEPEEVADVIAFLASADARFVNGVQIPVDGGQRLLGAAPHVLSGGPLPGSGSRQPEDRGPRRRDECQVARIGS